MRHGSIRICSFSVKNGASCEQRLRFRQNTRFNHAQTYDMHVCTLPCSFLQRQCHTNAVIHSFNTNRPTPPLTL